MKNKDKEKNEELEKLIDELNQLGDKSNISDEEYALLTKKIEEVFNKTTTKKERFFAKLQLVLIHALIYFVILCACFGLYSKQITFENKLYPFIFFLIFTLFQVLIKYNPLSAFIKKRKGMILGYVLQIVVTVITLFFVHPYLYFVDFNTRGFLFGFYFTAELLYLVYLAVSIRRRLKR